MTRFLSTMFLASICTTGLAQAPLSPVPIAPLEQQWQGSPAMAGAQSQWLLGAADATGIYAQRVKLAPGALIPAHTHSDQRFSVVLSGTIYVGFSETFDESKAVAIPAGTMYIAPAGVPHFVWAKEGAAEYQESGMGPSRTAFIPSGN